jgi:DNA polymerase (family 10)
LRRASSDGSHERQHCGIFDKIADLLDIQSANAFRVRAYRNAARTVGDLGTDINTLVERGMALTDIPGIGEDLAKKIKEIIETDSCEFLQRLEREVPPAVAQLLKVPGLGPKRVKTLWKDLDIQTLEQLLHAAQAQRIRDLPGFGEKTEQKILEAVQQRLAQSPRVKLATAAQLAEPLAAYLRQQPGVQQVCLCGSYRRMRETVGDLDLVVTAADAGPVMTAFNRYPEVGQALSSGPTRSTIVLQSGLQVDLRVVSGASWGAALQYFTGSKAHNIVVRRMAQERGLKLNEYGVFRGDQPIAGETEESVYAAVGLPWLPPELREDRGEIEAALKGALPALIQLPDLQGDLHAHTKASDGRNTLEEMARSAQSNGLHYLAITEHSQRLAVARGLDPVRLEQQALEIERVNETLSGFTLLKGVEVDILDDGALDLPDAALANLDIVVAAVHSRFDLPRAKQTERILKALDNRNVHILAHPTGRLLEKREPYDVDMQKIIRHAKARGVALEVNAHPDRLDLSDTYCRMAKDEGALVSINSDSHSEYEIDLLRFGVGQARRGWLEKQDVLNTKSLGDLRAWLRK